MFDFFASCKLSKVRPSGASRGKEPVRIVLAIIGKLVVIAEIFVRVLADLPELAHSDF